MIRAYMDHGFQAGPREGAATRREKTTPAFAVRQYLSSLLYV